ncbi:MAG: hypothetical protein RL757_2531 [Bacteroidota bacterium]|jgi:hypothetical protein
MKNIVKNAFLMVSTAFLMGSCQDVIDLDLNSSSPQIVIEGLVSNNNPTTTIQITKTTDYFNPTIPPPVSGAVVTINDGTTTDTLRERASGVYVSSNIRGTSGKTYTLKVVVEGKTYTSVSTMPPLVTLDSIGFRPNSRFGTSPDSLEYSPIIQFRDPPVLGNFYRVKSTVEGKLNNIVSIGSDTRLLENGGNILIPIFQVSVKTKKRLEVAFWAIDEGVYKYFETLSEQTSPQGGGSSAPTNPTSNISGGALGYFAAAAISVRTATAP